MRSTDPRAPLVVPDVRHRALRWVLLAGLLLLAAAVVWSLAVGRNPSGTVSDLASIEYYIQEASRLFREQRVDEALAALEKAKRSDPTSARPYLLKAELLMRSAHYREAYEEVAAAYRIAPNDPEATLTLLRMMRGFFPAAEVEKLARKAIAQAPNSGEAYYHLGLAIASTVDPKRYPEAMQAFKRASELAPSSAVTLIEMGKLYSQMGDNDRAEAMLKHAGRLLDMQRARGALPASRLEEWLRQRRAAAFWRAQVYRRMGRAEESRAATAEADRWSAQGQELRMLRDRAAASPPDLKARARLLEILRGQR